MQEGVGHVFVKSRDRAGPEVCPSLGITFPRIGNSADPRRGCPRLDLSTLSREASRQGPILRARTKLPGKRSGGGRSVLSNALDGALAGVLGQLLPWVLPNLWEHQLGHWCSLEGAQGAATELARKPAGVPGDSAGIFPLGHWKSAGMPTDTV